MKFVIKFLVIFLCFSCTQKPALVINQSKNFYAKNSQVGKKKSSNNFSNNSSLGEIKSANQIVLKDEDTLHSVAKKYQVNQQDLISLNSLKPPYILKGGSVLKIPAPRIPQYHEVKSGETLYAISRIYNMKIDKLIETNDLKEPYSLKSGQQIKISKIENIQVQNSTENKSEKSASKLEDKAKKSENVIEKVSDKFFAGQFSWPIRGTIISKFGPKQGGLYNDGINIKAKEGVEVKSSESGVVAYVGNELKGYGNLIIIKHSGGWITAYAHLQKTLVKRGQKIAKGEKIATVGSTGNVTSAQLYFGLRKGRDAVNPQNYLR